MKRPAQPYTIMNNKRTMMKRTTPLPPSLLLSRKSLVCMFVVSVVLVQHSIAFSSHSLLPERHQHHRQLNSISSSLRQWRLQTTREAISLLKATGNSKSNSVNDSDSDSSNEKNEMEEQGGRGGENASFFCHHPNKP